MQNRKTYILYKYDKFNNDFENLKEFHDIKEIKKEFNFKNNKSIYQFIKNSLEDNYIKLIDNKYLIIREIL